MIFNNLLQVVLSGLTLVRRVQEPARRAQLLDSVRRAAQRGGELTKRLLTVARRQSLRPKAIDLGAGMSEATQARVFEPFFTTKRVGEGTGLGLAQVCGFARQSGGSVRLHSRLGQGTTVAILLPVSKAAVPAPAPAADAAAPQATLGTAVLVCEDDEVAALVIDMLAQLGHAPTRLSNAAAALGALADGRPVDLLFTDVLMPGGMNGLALAREAGRRAPLDVPVLRKPYKLQDLAHALQGVLALTPAKVLAE